MSRPRVARHHDDRGVTLVELTVAMAVFLILITITFPVLNTFYSVDNGITKTVASVNQILPATTTLERYLRSAVQPAPPTVVTPGLPGTPIPMFAPVAGASPQTYQVGSNSFAFYSNVGDQYGPVLVNGSVSGPNSSNLYTLTITAQEADSGTCPGTAAPMSTSPTSTCTYTNNPKKPIGVLANVTNGSAADANPIFAYSIVANNDGTPQFASPYTVPLGWQCTSATACNPANMTAVQITINTQATVGSLASIKTVVYFQAPSYTATVG